MEMKLIDSGVVGRGQDIIYVNGKYYMVSRYPAKVSVSEDFETWEEYLLDESYLSPEQIAYGNGTFIIAGGRGSRNHIYVYVSKDGRTWSPKQLPDIDSQTPETNNRDIEGLGFVNNRFVMFVNTSRIQIVNKVRTEYCTMHIYETFDGKNISKYTYTRSFKSNFNNNLIRMSDISYNNNLYVAVGERGAIYTSNNLKNWTIRNSGLSKEKNFDSDLRAITYGRGTFVAISYSHILTSKDGINWQKQQYYVYQNPSDVSSVNDNDALATIDYANGIFVIGGDKSFLWSTDGLNWVRVTGSAKTLYGMTYSKEKFVFVGWGLKSGNVPIYYVDTTRDLTDSAEDNSLFFFDNQLNMLGVVDTFVSLRWRRKYFEAGEFEIVLPVSEYIMRWLNLNIIVMRNNYEEAGIIETIEFRDDGANEEVTISGRFLSSILERRIIREQLNFSGQSVEGMNYVVERITPFTSQWEIQPPQASSRSISFQATYKNVYDFLCRLSEYSNVGFRVVPNVESKVYLFETWQGVDRSYNQQENEQYTFSDENKNIEQGSLVLSNKTKYTYVLVGGVGEGSSRIMNSVDTGARGFEMFEMFNDQKSLSNDNLTTTAYKNQLKDIGTSSLCDGIITFEVNSVSINDYRTKWNLGDIVNIEKTKWGQSTTKRIIEVEEIIEDGNKSILPTFGSPLASAWKDE